MTNYFITLNLELLNNTIVTSMDIGDKEEEGIFIPFRPNRIHRGKYGEIIFWLFATEKRSNVYGQSHYIQVYASNEAYKELKKEGLNNPVIGNMKLSYKVKKKPQINISFDEAFNK